MSVQEQRGILVATSGRVPAESPSELVLADLLNDAATIAQLMLAEMRRGSWLDAYLLAAGLNQVVEDWLHRDLLSLRKVVGVLRGAGASGRLALGLALRLRAIGLHFRRLRPSERRTVRWQHELESIVERLATLVIDGHVAPNEIIEHTERVAAELAHLPASLGGAVLRLPTCFRSLDQRTEDCEELASRFADRWPDRGRRLLAVGLRTSGSYLAPLVAASLRQLGYSVQVLTLRPAQDVLPNEAAELSRARASAALVLICDDPPDSGASLASAAAQLEAVGVEQGNVVFLVALLTGLPERLGEYPAVTLPSEAWAIQSLLAPEAVKEMLSAHSVERLPLIIGRDLKTDPTLRRHARALYRVVWHGGTERLVYAKGIGLGYFGRHALAVTQSLGEYLPETLAVHNGILFREWLPEQHRISLPAEETDLAMGSRVAAYVVDRARRMPAVADHSLLLAGRHPLWQRVADRLGGGFRGLRPVVRPALHRLAHRLLEVSRPSVVDGNVTLAQWFQTGVSSGAVKVDYDERAFSNEDLVVYDAAWDLAVAAADAEMEGAGRLAAVVRESFERRSGEPIDEARWVLYRIEHLLGFAGTMRELRMAEGEEPEGVLHAEETAIATAERILLQYLAQRVLPDLGRPSQGPLCGVDVDGVLETGWLGLSSTTPAGVLALRALSCHGYRPVLATGRSLPEVVARCEALGLAGGVAEYGAVAYDAQRGTHIELLQPDQRDALERGRTELERLPGVHVDARFQHCVRAFRFDSVGQRRALSPALVETALAAARDLRAVTGWGQTDFIPVAMHKGVGLRALTELIVPEAAGHSRPLALAVGDSEQDLPMFLMAERAWAPANGRQLRRLASVNIASRGFQAGLAQAAASLISHKPGGCPVCRPLPPHGADGLLMSALGAQDATRWSRLSLGWRLYWRSAS